MQLDSVMVRASAPADVRRLVRAGGEVWQEHFQGMGTGVARWRYALVKIPAATAIRLQLVALGAELREVAETMPTPPAAKRRSPRGVTQRLARTKDREAS